MEDVVYYCGACRREYNLPQREVFEMVAGACGVCGDLCWYSGFEEVNNLPYWAREKFHRIGGQDER